MSVSSPAQSSPLEFQPVAVPWSVGDSWLGVGSVILLQVGAMVAVVIAYYSSAVTSLLTPFSKYLEAAGATALELLYVLPVGVILLWRHGNLRSLGFRRFGGSVLGLGCALLAGTYMVLMVYGAILAALKIETQGDVLTQLLSASKWPVGYVIPTVIAAPFAEEVFFRGFLFQGLRQKIGWNRAALVSSSVFAILHLQWAALLPMFVLGYLLSFLYNRSNSIWPGIILHGLVNSFGMCLLLAALQFPHL